MTLIKQKPLWWHDICLHSSLWLKTENFYQNIHSFASTVPKSKLSLSCNFIFCLCTLMLFSLVFDVRFSFIKRDGFIFSFIFNSNSKMSNNLLFKKLYFPSILFLIPTGEQVFFTIIYRPIDDRCNALCL